MILPKPHSTAMRTPLMTKLKRSCHEPGSWMGKGSTFGARARGWWMAEGRRQSGRAPRVRAEVPPRLTVLWRRTLEGAMHVPVVGVCQVAEQCVRTGRVLHDVVQRLEEP